MNHEAIHEYGNSSLATSRTSIKNPQHKHAQSVCAARQRDFYGAGGSAQEARDAAYNFLRIGIGASAFEDGCMMLMSAALLQKGDVAVAFSYSGQTLVVVEAVRQAHKNGAHTIAVPNHADSLLAKEADLALCVRAENSPLSGEGAAARLPQLGLVDELFMAVVKTSPAVTERGPEAHDGRRQNAASTLVSDPAWPSKRFAQ